MCEVLVVKPFMYITGPSVDPIIVLQLYSNQHQRSAINDRSNALVSLILVHNWPIAGHTNPITSCLILAVHAVMQKQICISYTNSLLASCSVSCRLQ